MKIFEEGESVKDVSEVFGPHITKVHLKDADRRAGTVD
jgi:hypothetical protein